MAGVNAAVVQRPAGHASINTTAMHCTGIPPEALRDAQAQLPFREAIGDVSSTYHLPKRTVKVAAARVVSDCRAAG